MPNPLTDELTPEAKAELAAVFAAMKRRRNARYEQPVQPRRPFWDRPHTYRSGW